MVLDLVIGFLLLLAASYIGTTMALRGFFGREYFDPRTGEFIGSGDEPGNGDRSGGGGEPSDGGSTGSGTTDDPTDGEAAGEDDTT